MDANCEPFVCVGEKKRRLYLSSAGVHFIQILFQFEWNKIFHYHLNELLNYIRLWLNVEYTNYKLVCDGDGKILRIDTFTISIKIYNQTTR